ncbi:MAG: peptide deformylase [bacterium]|nr:peptide deformylase [bacterium]
MIKSFDLGFSSIPAQKKATKGILHMLKIVKYPASILTKKAKEVEEITPDLLSFVSQMEIAMEKNQGVGLAAPQIGVSKQIILVRGERKNQVFFNPKIRSKDKKGKVDEEGCLSLPGLFLPIKRAERVQVFCLTKDGKPVLLLAEGLAARIFQHEIDHLLGKLIIERITPLQRWKIREELNEIRKKGRVQKK